MDIVLSFNPSNSIGLTLFSFSILYKVSRYTKTFLFYLHQAISECLHLLSSDVAEKYVASMT